MKERLVRQHFHPDDSIKAANSSGFFDRNSKIKTEMTLPVIFDTNHWSFYRQIIKRIRNCGKNWLKNTSKLT